MSSQQWLSPPQTCISIERQLQKFPTVAVSSVCGFFFFFGRAFLWLWALFSRSCALFTEPTNLFFNKIFIKNESHSTIHTFKNYFIIIFSIFTKIRVSKHTFNLYLYLTIPHLLLSIYLFIFYFCVYLKRYSYSVYSSSFF